jgi:hypothetical protein
MKRAGFADPDPLVRAPNPRIRAKVSRIRNTAYMYQQCARKYLYLYTVTDKIYKPVYGSEPAVCLMRIPIQAFSEPKLNN